MEKFLKLKADIERLEKIANPYAPESNKDLRNKFFELQHIMDDIESYYNSIQISRKTISNIYENIQKYREKLSNIEEHIFKYESMLERRNELQLSEEVIKNYEKMLEQSRNSAAIIRENIDKHMKEYIAKQQAIEKLEKAANESISQVPQLIKIIESIILSLQMGGGNYDEQKWKQKYLKYKAKYLKLKTEL